MAMVLEKVVPFGRSLDEYIQMFQLTPTDLSRTILGVGDGPASFNAEGSKQGYPITSVDPVYEFTGREIEARFHAVVDSIIDQVKATPNDWVWTYHGSPEGLRANRIQALKTFLSDYEISKQQGRYITGSLPNLPFGPKQFSLALCSHFLFLYSDHLSFEFHVQSIQDMLRVASEVRIFPLVTLMLHRSPYLDEIINSLTEEGYLMTIQPVKYELQKGGNEMLVIRHPM